MATSSVETIITKVTKLNIEKIVQTTSRLHPVSFLTPHFWAPWLMFWGSF
jgi:hypothetical protein